MTSKSFVKPIIVASPSYPRDAKPLEKRGFKKLEDEKPGDAKTHSINPVVY
jgi:hypothetical protein